MTLGKPPGQELREEISLLRHPIVCLVVSGYITLLDYNRVNPVCRPQLCHAQGSLLLVQQQQEVSVWVPPCPKWSPGRHKHKRDSKGLQRLHPWDQPSEPQFLQEGFLCRIVVAALAMEKLPFKSDFIKIKISDGTFSIWLLIAENSKNPKKSSETLSFLAASLTVSCELSPYSSGR